MIPPGSTLGVLGGGQLGRMFTIAARNLGYRVWTLDPDPDCPAGATADHHLTAGYSDQAAIRRLAETCAAVTIEFENVPAETLAFLEQHLPVRPSANAVAVTRDRIVEKTFIQELGLSTAKFVPVRSSADIGPACEQLRLPALLKTAQFGYDGKGQVVIDDAGDALAGFQALRQVPCVMEERVELKKELSVLLARGMDGAIACYPVAENVHRNGILHTTRVPAAVSEDVAQRAIAIAGKLAAALDYCGVMAVEFFLDKDGQLLINEIAPRPHNSGHYSLDACVTSQFEQQVRALCGLALGDSRLLSPVVMLNLLGDLWKQDRPPDWRQVFGMTGAKLHLYGKKNARAGRKMGHINCLANTVEEATANADSIFKLLSA